MDLEKTFSKFKNLYADFDTVFANPQILGEKNFLIAKRLVLYNRLFLFCFFQKLKLLVTENETIFCNSKEIPTQTFEGLIQISLLGDFQKQRDEQKFLFSVWNVLNRVDFFCNSSLLDLDTKISNLILNFNRTRVEVPSLESELRVLVNDYNVLLKKILQLKQFRDSIFKEFFAFKDFPESRFYFIVFLLFLDREIFLLLGEAEYFLKHLKLVAPFFDSSSQNFFSD